MDFAIDIVIIRMVDNNGLIINWSSANIAATEPKFKRPRLLTELYNVNIVWDVRIKVIKDIMDMAIIYLRGLLFFWLCLLFYYYSLENGGYIYIYYLF